MNKDKNEGNPSQKSRKNPRRTFLGKIPIGGKTKLTALEKKEFRAYTLGFNSFFHGKDLIGSPIEHKVRVAYI